MPNLCIQPLPLNMYQECEQIIWLLAAFVPVTIWLYIWYWSKKFKYWQKKGVSHVPGKFPYGSDSEYTKADIFPGHLIKKMYDKFSNEPFFGIYLRSEPFLILRDPEVIRLVLAKEFTHFKDRMGVELCKDDVLTHHLFMLDGPKWRALRVKLTPVFTSGKLKAMFPLFVKCAEALNNLLLNMENTTIDIKDITARFSTDVICSCAFGLDVDFLGNSNSHFRKLVAQRYVILSKKLSFYRLKLIVQRFISNYFPFAKNANSMPRITSKELETFMMKTISDTVEHREVTGQKRNDFIDLLISLKNKGPLNEVEAEENIEPVVMTLEVMAAQCMVFFAAGFETSSSVKSYCLYELALNQDIQDILYKEIMDSLAKHGEITYQSIHDMEYLDMVISETMRKYPTLHILNRICAKPYTFSNGYKIKKGQKIIIPVWSLHHDPNLYPNPENFDPERFSKGNKEYIHPFSYLPFGEGPRICIGMRFGLLQTKMGILTVLRNYRVELSERTVVPLKLKGEHNPSTRPAQPIILRLTKRKTVK